MQSRHSQKLVLTPAEMARADAMTIADALFSGSQLMDRAAAALVEEFVTRWPQADCVDVLCGPGNNGGDGYAAAGKLAALGLDVKLYAEGRPRAGSDAELAAGQWKGEPQPLARFRPSEGRPVVDALYGAGLARPLSPEASKAARLCREAGAPVLAVDLPSGLSGETGLALGEVFSADVTVTFARRKPGHLLANGPDRCGTVKVADIGIPDRIVAASGAQCFENDPALWLASLPSPGWKSHKYSRGHVLVLSGGLASTGAARLSAMAAARAGAGAVTLGSPREAISVNAAHLTAIMLAEINAAEDVSRLCEGRRVRAAVLGPGFGRHEKLRDFTQALLSATGLEGLVLDADAFTAWRGEGIFLFAALAASQTAVVMTPHEGEFARLFPDMAETPWSKLRKAREAARLSGATIVYKGADTVIAAPDGRAAINVNGSPWLATAGSGDVLAGILAGLLGQGMPAWEAACAAVWMHSEAAHSFGPGLIAEDLPGRLPAIQRRLLDQQKDES